MKIEKVVEEFLKLLSQGKVEEAGELIVKEAKGVEDEVTAYLLKVGLKILNEGDHVDAWYLLVLAKKIAKSEALLGLITQGLTIVHHNYANQLTEMKKYEEAAYHYRESLRINPEFAEAHNNYGILLKKMKKYEEAAYHYKKALEINPEFAEAHNNYGILLQEMKKYEEAESHYRKALEINPEYSIAHCNYASLLEKMKRNEKAENHYRESLRINPESAIAHYDYANLLKEMKKYEEAEFHYKKALKIDPEHLQAHYNLADLLAEAKRSEEAEFHYKKALKIDSEFAEAHNNYAVLLQEMKRSEEAEFHYKKALEIDSEFAITHYDYANLLKEMKKSEEAEFHYKKALKIDSEFAEASANLGFQYFTTDELDSAFCWFEKARNQFEKQYRNIDSKKMEAFIDWILARKSWENFSFSEEETHSNLEKSQEHYLEAAAKFKEINLIQHASILEFLSNAIFISRDYLYSLDSETLIKMRNKMNTTHDLLSPLYENFKKIPFPDIDLLNAQFTCIETLTKCLNFEDIDYALIYAAIDVFHHYEFSESLQAATAIINFSHEFNKSREEYRSLEEIPEDKQRELLKMVRPFSVLFRSFPRETDQLMGEKLATPYTEEIRKVLREELRESERRVLSGFKREILPEIEQLFAKYHSELLKSIDALSKAQLEEFKSTISEIIEEKIENIEDPNEKEKNKNEYNKWKRAFNIAATAIQIVGSIASIYTLLTGGRPEEAVNGISTIISIALSKIERI